MTLEQLAEEWLRAARVKHGLAKSTLKSWSYWMRRFCAHVGPGATIESWDLAHLEAWLYILREEPARGNRDGRRPRTVRGAFAPCRAFGRYLIERGLVTTNPALAIALPKLDAPDRARVSNDEIDDMLGACCRLPSDYRAALAYAVLCVLAYTGLRRSELLALTVGDVCASERTLAVQRGKGSKARIELLKPACVDAITAWLRFRPVCRHSFLFAVDSNRRLGDAGLRTLLRDVAAVAGHRGSPHITPHAIRRNCATWIMDRTGDIRVSQAMLGHSSARQTEEYIGMDAAWLRKQIDALPDRGPATPPTPPAPAPHHTTTDRRRPGSDRRKSAWRRE